MLIGSLCLKGMVKRIEATKDQWGKKKCTSADLPPAPLGRPPPSPQFLDEDCAAVHGLEGLGASKPANVQHAFLEAL